jgi:short-subunit dehydrogenase
MASGMNYRTIAITGASSGIGAALAIRLAEPGRTLALLGRDVARLGGVATACTSKGAACRTASIDVRDAGQMSAFFLALDRDSPIDLLIASAGILDGRHDSQVVEDGATARHVLETNLIATIETVHLVLPGMRRRRHGGIALVASLAALVPLPDAPAYSASKAALLFYGLALRDAVADDGVRVVVACPGFVSTPMGRIHVGQRPDEVSADAAAIAILNGLRANRSIIGFPTIPHWLSRLSLLVPESVRRRGMRKTRFHVAS